MADISILPTDVPRLIFYAGDSFTFPTYTIQPGGVTTDFSGSTWKAQWRATPESDAFVELTVDVSQANVGKFGISATAAQTEGMSGLGVWDLQATTGGVVKTWLRGNISGHKDVTRG